MNWTKVKVILIILFLIINALLAGILISKSFENAPFPKNISEDILTILESRNISVTKSLIDTKTRFAKCADAYPISSESSDFFNKLKQTADVSENGSYLLGSSRITFYENFVHFDNLDSSIHTAEEYFKTVGLDFSSAKLVSVSGDGSVEVYTETYNGLDIFGSSAKVTFSEGAVASADVTWYEITEKHASHSKTISFTEGLLEFAADKSRGNQPCTVSDITFGYSIDAGSAYASVSQMIPCIRITTDIGSSFYYDARSPEQ